MAGIFRIGQIGVFQTGGGPAIDFASRKLYEPFAVPHACLGDLEVFGEIEPEDLKRHDQVETRIGVGDQVDYQVGILDPFVEIPFRTSNVLLQKRQVWMIQAVRNFVDIEIDRGHGVPLLKQSVCKMAADESTSSQYEDLHVI